MGQRRSQSKGLSVITDDVPSDLQDNDDISEESPMDKYDATVKDYLTTVRVAFGYGESGQSCLDNAYDDVEKAYYALNDEDRKMTILPQK